MTAPYLFAPHQEDLAIAAFPQWSAFMQVTTPKQDRLWFLKVFFLLLL
jgi:hypothetical protein